MVLSTIDYKGTKINFCDNDHFIANEIAINICSAYFTCSYILCEYCPFSHRQNNYYENCTAHIKALLSSYLKTHPELRL